MIERSFESSSVIETGSNFDQVRYGLIKGGAYSMKEIVN